MNANKRMKYASTPTYGMQKRGFSKGQAPQQVPAPDFTRMPVPEVPMVPMPQQPVVGAFVPPPLFPSGNSGFPPVGTVLPPTSMYLPQQGVPPMGTSGIPMQGPSAFGGPSFLQSTPMQNPLQPGSGMMAQGMPPSPLGNSPTISQPKPVGFTPRQQGYVPPMQQSAPTQPMGAMNQFSHPGTDPLVSRYHAPYQTMPMASTPYLPTGMHQAVPQNPYLNLGSMAGGPPMAGAMGGAMNIPPMQQPMMPPQAGYPSMPKANHGSFDLNKGLMYFLFGALPLLFIPCLFVPASWDFLRYVFIVLCVVGIGLMWYRQLFAPSTRTTVTIIYAALCIVSISILLSGSRDVQTTNANGGTPQQTVQPANTTDPMAAMATQEPEETPAPASAPGQSPAEESLIAFMDFWTVSKIDDMISLVQPSWVAQQDAPNQALFNILLNRVPMDDYTIESISGSDSDNARTIDMSAYIDKQNNKKELTRYRFKIIMVKEGGGWYIDPNSLATNDIAPTPDPNATPDPKATVAVTLAPEAPRTTVTPVPPGDTKLYYNPNKGSFYHADPECSAVDESFLPLQGSFLYKDLKEWKKTLQPCLKCNAPVNPPGEE